jgi:hypothetical protein
LVGTAVLVAGPVRIGAVAFDVQTMIATATCFIVGIQMAALALVSRAYAARLDLLPPSPRLDRLLERVALERGLVIGAVLLLLGFACFVAALLRWRAAGYGPLRADDIRTPLAGMVLIVAGVQIAMVSFTLSLTRIGEY